MERDTIPLFYAESPQTTEPIDDIAPEHISVIAGAFWGVLGLLIIVLICLILWHVYKERAKNLLERIEWQNQQNQRQHELLDRLNAQDTITSSHEKPNVIPMVVVLPNNEVAFGWEIPSISPKERIDILP